MQIQKEGRKEGSTCQFTACVGRGRKFCASGSKLPRLAEQTNAIGERVQIFTLQVGHLQGYRFGTTKHKNGFKEV